MTLDDARKAYYEFSGQVSSIARQLSYAGIAIIWIFKAGDAEHFVIPGELVKAGFFIASALLLDFFQYSWAAAAWGRFGRLKEKEGQKNFDAPAWINRPTLFFFGGSSQARP